MSDKQGSVLALGEVVLAQARELARAGRYIEAQELLASLADEGDWGVAVLDLKARIHAQQGRLDEADRCWADVAALSPDHQGAAEGRRRIAVVRARAARGIAGRALTSRFALRATAAVVALLAFVMLVDLWRDDRELRREPSATATAAAPVRSASPSTSDDVLATLPVEGTGVRVQRRPGEIAVTFELGLFRSGATLLPQGRAVLDALGARLRPHGDRIAITVIGHTDRSAVRPGGEYASNTELGTVRATVVREVLRLSARMPTSRFTVSTLADMFPPYPGDGGAARNRTVSLRISTAGAP